MVALLVKLELLGSLLPTALLPNKRFVSLRLVLDLQPGKWSGWLRAYLAGKKEA